ncbi:DUF4292 domain-containing protein [Emticicia sp. TH156]|uniref:DUF4292 domain-containing protein n=1 Tax=Emticicia sp. TH156 TaxID=2067454 RepID=UPI000C75BA41|nr:DUF4292 domain-containing protein [Emticicia sp. TH156]PLK42518.1 hypothetical protein C0V77_20025 [Emticicia sp. TH156]
MLNRYIVLTFSCLVIIFTSACKRHKIYKTETSDSTNVAIAQAGAPAQIDSVAPSVNLAKINVTPAEVDFRFLKIRSKINYTSGTESQSFPVTVHVEKDNKIWLSIAVGLEVARGIITQDSVIFIDRLHRTYYKYDFASLSRRFKFNLNYNLVQSILIGNMPLLKRETDDITRQDGNFVIRQLENGIAIENFIAESNLKLLKLTAAESTSGNRMQIDYSNFLEINNFLFPQEIITKIDTPKDDKTTQTFINLQHNRVEFLNESPGFSFSIPRGYSSN